MKTIVQINVPMWWLILILLTSSITGTATLAKFIIKKQQPEDYATVECRKVVRGSIPIELETGILCLRPVHFIAE